MPFPVNGPGSPRLSCQRQAPHRGGASRFEGVGTGAQGGAGGAYVIYEKNLPAPQQPVAAGEGTGGVPLPLMGAVGSGLRRRVLEANQRPLSDWQRGKPAQLPCEQERLSVSTLPQPVGVKGDRCQDSGGKGMATQVLLHERRQRGSQGFHVLVLELQDRLAHCAFKAEDGAYAVDLQWTIGAVGADDAGRNGLSAPCAERQLEARQNRCAGGTKKGTSRPTTDATSRKEEVERRPFDLFQCYCSANEPIA